MNHRISLVEQGLSKGELVAFEAVRANADEALDLGVRGLAGRCGVSTATIVRMAKKLGYRGFTDLIYHIRSEGGNPGGETSGTMFPPSMSPLISLNAAPNLMSGVAMAARRLHHTKGIVHTYGHGFSSIMAEYLTRKLARLEVRSRALNADNSLLDFENVADERDTIALFSRSGMTKRVVEYGEVARDAGINVISFTNGTDNPLRRLSNIAIIVPDDRPMDNRNTYPTLYFASCITIIEMIVARYYELTAS